MNTAGPVRSEPHPKSPNPLRPPESLAQRGKKTQTQNQKSERNISPPAATTPATATATMSALAPAPRLQPDERSNLLSLLAAASRPLADVVADFLARFPLERRLRVGAALGFLLEVKGPRRIPIPIPPCPSPHALLGPPSCCPPTALLAFVRLRPGSSRAETDRGAVWFHRLRVRGGKLDLVVMAVLRCLGGCSSSSRCEITVVASFGVSLAGG